ncbi:MAG: acetyl/propionyl/methylcrotonyl-CoA carboxylase subunit alpha [Oligoflexales bacterium]
MFKRVLIANRGEIAVRVIRTLREMNIESVAVYSQQDKHSLHCSYANYAFPLLGQTPAETYLNIEQLIRAAKETGADAVHPAYGFLSENSEFSRACAQAGITFIGPSADAMELMGNKIKAKELMIKNDVPVVPGSQGALTSHKELEEVINKIGLPVILKAAAGGGGRGMRIVRNKEELKASFDTCQREALNYFASDKVFCERYVENPRHIEIQVLFDNHGNGVHLFERDCSIQRRHQKLFEEAPSAFLNNEQRAHLGGLAVKAAKAANYSGAGTVEFICENPETAYFMEMNTRIQVEHPVTEAITGVDLIREQIQVAAGKKLSLRQDEIHINGWSMEARVNAEDPGAGFLPTPGLIKNCHIPLGPFVRVDTHIYPGYEIPGDYDSMIAKVIVWGRTREEARVRLLRSLSEFSILGITSTIPFQEALLNHKKFQEADFDTGFYERESDYFAKALNHVEPEMEAEAAIAALVSFQNHIQTKNSDPNNGELVGQLSQWKRTALISNKDKRLNR